MTRYLKEVAIAGLVTMECVALLSGIDGHLLALAMAIVGGIAGYTLKTVRS